MVGLLKAPLKGLLDPEVVLPINAISCETSPSISCIILNKLLVGAEPAVSKLGLAANALAGAAGVGVAVASRLADGAGGAIEVQCLGLLIGLKLMPISGNFL